MNVVQTLTTPRVLPPVFSLRELIPMADAANEILDLVEKVEFELPILLRPLKARR